ncbi:MAG: hypothetical protein PHQ75_05095, partial [Thermoguttaceae bacterium]|nr:hypothetical protein [Thermoguttaceae bacterium]
FYAKQGTLMTENEMKKEMEDNIPDSKLKFRTILDPVAHYVLARPGAERNLLSFINAVFADKNEPLVEQVTIMNPFDAKTFPNEK